MVMYVNTYKTIFLLFVNIEEDFEEKTDEEKMNAAKQFMLSRYSGFKGLLFDKDREKWYAKIQHDGVFYKSPYCKYLEEAVSWYDAYIVYYFGEYGKTCEEMGL